MHSRLTRLVIVAALAAGACTTSSAQQPDTTQAPSVTTTSTTSTTTTTPSTTTTTTTTTIPQFPLTGTVTDPAGEPLPGAVVRMGQLSTTTDDAGAFDLGPAPAGPITVWRPAWLETTLDWDGSPGLTVALEPRIVRALRVSRYIFVEDMLEDTLAWAAGSTVNTLVFDTKDETGTVLYETEVEEAHRLDAVNPVYDPVEAIRIAKDAGLYTITRIVSFEDQVRVKADPESKLAGNWVNMTEPENWEYLLDLGVEACQIGFDEIQFDYVRFPAGRTATFARAKLPTTQDERVTAITAFLTEARTRLHPLGCAVSADIFAIVLSSPTDEGIGQRVEQLSHVVDAISPMIYPSHYSDGWLGFASPNDHPGPVVADALDDGIPRLEGPALMRPWLQAFYYVPSQILREIEEAESRGVGWILWNAGGMYNPNALPVAESVDE